MLGSGTNRKWIKWDKCYHLRILNALVHQGKASKQGAEVISPAVSEMLFVNKFQYFILQERAVGGAQLIPFI